MSKVFSLFLLIILPFFASSQDLDFQSVILPAELQKGANAMVRNERIEVEVRSVDKMTIHTERVVTVLNEYGKDVGRTFDVYDDATKIKKQEAVFYDRSGKQIKRVKKKDFSDMSLPGANLITDNRVSYFEYIPQEYPYTVVYTSEVESESTVFVNPWEPVPGYYVSVQNSSYILKNPANIPIRYEEKNLDTLQIAKVNSDLELNYQLKNFPAIDREMLSPDFEVFEPQVKIALEEFSLVGVKGTAADWTGFGKWQYDNLLSGKTELPEKTVEKIAALTADAASDLEKARLIYNYVQENTRYISVQLGIGGWEPMSAEEVDKLGYGDCKALTNYTRALLKSQNITSYYSVVYGGEDKIDLDTDFASMQGNHVILNIPADGEDVWLECTSQTTPFNYLGDFTDDRNVLMVKPEGGSIVRTKAYDTSENLQETFATVSIDPQGSFSAELSRKSRGVPYGNIYPIIRQLEKDQQLFYKNKWGHLRNLTIEKFDYINDQENIEFVEDMKLSGQKYAAKAGNRMLLPVHFLKPPTYSLPNDVKRMFPIQIQRGRTYNQNFEFVLPEGFETESLPESASIDNKYGSFTTSTELREKDGKMTIFVQSQYIVKPGLWSAKVYDDFRDFMNQVNSLGNQKAVIIKSI